jgi:hypothetical protein
MRLPTTTPQNSQQRSVFNSLRSRAKPLRLQRSERRRGPERAEPVPCTQACVDSKLLKNSRFGVSRNGLQDEAQRFGPALKVGIKARGSASFRASAARSPNAGSNFRKCSREIWCPSRQECASPPSIGKPIRIELCSIGHTRRAVRPWMRPRTVRYLSPAPDQNNAPARP